MTVHYLALFSSVLLVAFSQVLLKIAALRQRSESARLLLNGYVVVGYGLMMAALVLNLFGLRQVPVVHMAFILPWTFVLVPVLSRLMLGERLSSRYWLGSALICAGAVLFNLQALF